MTKDELEVMGRIGLSRALEMMMWNVTYISTGGLLGSVAVCRWLASLIPLWLIHANWVKIGQELKTIVAASDRPGQRQQYRMSKASMMGLSSTLSVRIRNEKCMCPGVLALLPTRNTGLVITSYLPGLCVLVISFFCSLKILSLNRRTEKE